MATMTFGVGETAERGLEMAVAMMQVERENQHGCRSGAVECNDDQRGEGIVTCKVEIGSLSKQLDGAQQPGKNQSKLQQ
eukprot:m.27989 g.27989  ORF g.27989 m.27989 type:complete len:79 (+) comp11798_c0_seq1:701-937(+)